MADVVVTNTTTGEITVTTGGATSGLPNDAQGKTVLFTPNVQKALPTPGVTGAIDWACTSDSSATATARGLAGFGLGTLPAKYAPSECK